MTVFLKILLAAGFGLGSAVVCAQTVDPHAPHQDTVRHRDPNAIINKLENYCQRTGLIPRLLREIMVFDTPVDSCAINIVTQDFSENAYERHRGKIISDIWVKVLDPHGTSVDDTLLLSANFIEKAGNAVHLKTRERHILNRIIFRQGDTLTPLALSESERLLRSTPYIFDAKVIVQSDSGDQSVTVWIIVRDAWNIAVDGSGDPGGLSAQGTLRDVNFVGRGHTLAMRTEYFNAFEEGPFVDLRYAIPNLFKSNINAFAQRNDRPLFLEESVGAGRGFFATTVRHAGGINVMRFTEKNPLTTEVGAQPAPMPITQSADLWVGRAFAAGQRDAKEWFVAGRGLATRRANRPVADTIRQLMSESNLYLLSFGHSRRRYFKEDYLFFLNRSEDMPAGRMYSVTGGLLQDEYFTNAYVGAQSGFSNYIHKLGYLSVNARVGGFFHSDDFRRGGLSGELGYYTPVLEPGVWKFRSLLWLRADHSMQGVNSRPFNINNRDGIRGFAGGLPGGAKRFTVSNEYVFFSPTVFNGFRFAYVLFADWAWLAASNQSLFEGGFFQGYGLGLRFKNNNFIFRTFQLSFAWYPPSIGAAGQQYAFLFDDTRFFRFNQPEFGRPTTVGF